MQGYDSIGFSIDLSEKMIMAVSQILPNVINNLNFDQGQINGNLRNLRIKLFNNRLSFIGSIPKFLRYDNLIPADTNDIFIFIQAIEKIFHINLMEARVHLIDFTIDVLLQNKVESYLPLLGESKRFIRGKFSRHSLYYSLEGKSKRLLFYDKIREQKRVGSYISEDLMSKNILRYELRLRYKALKQLVDLPTVTLKMLADKSFFKFIQHLAFKEYDSISKIRKLDLGCTSITELNRSNAIKLITKILIDQYGHSELSQVIEIMKTRGCFKDKYVASRVKRYFKELQLQTSEIIPDPLIDELNLAFDVGRVSNKGNEYSYRKS